MDKYVPTLDRPFGIYLWDFFDVAWKAVLGYSANDFEFVPGKTPLSTSREVAAVIVAYYAIIFGGRAVMKSLDPIKLNTLFQIHNFVLTAISAILLVLLFEQYLGIIVRHGVYYSICSENCWSQRIVTIYYVRGFWR